MASPLAYIFTRCYCDEATDSTARVANRKIVSNNPCARIGRRSIGSRTLMLCKSRLIRFWLFHKPGPFPPFARCNRRTSAPVALAILFCCVNGTVLFSADKAQGTSFSAVLEGKETDIVQAVEDVVRDTVIHGTYVYDREKTLGGADEEKSSKVFGEWGGGGKVYYKVAHDALAPRNFKGSEDQGTITVRFILKGESPERFRIQIDAVFVETERRAVHPSEGLVESSEFKEITERLKGIQLQEQKDADSKARIDAQIAAKDEMLRRRQEEVTKLADAESSAQDLVKRVQDLRHKVEMRAGPDGAHVRSAPFQAAATLETLKQSTDVVVLILTPYWFGIETNDGHRGWVRKEELVPLP
jgi:hypothetical protein